MVELPSAAARWMAVLFLFLFVRFFYSRGVRKRRQKKGFFEEVTLLLPRFARSGNMRNGGSKKVPFVVISCVDVLRTRTDEKRNQLDVFGLRGKAHQAGDRILVDAQARGSGPVSQEDVDRSRLLGFHGLEQRGRGPAVEGAAVGASGEEDLDGWDVSLRRGDVEGCPVVGF